MSDQQERPIYSKQTTVMIVDAEQTRTLSINTLYLTWFKPIVVTVVIVLLMCLLSIAVLIGLNWHYQHALTEAKQQQQDAQTAVLAMRQKVQNLQNITSSAVERKLAGLNQSEQSVLALQNYLKQRGVPIAPLKSTDDKKTQGTTQSKLAALPVDEDTDAAGGPNATPANTGLTHANTDSSQIKILTPIPYMQPYSKQVDKLYQISRRVPIGYPHYGRMSSRFGYRNNPFGTGTREFHGGLDFKGVLGEPIYATADGKVIVAGRQNGYGLVVKIKHGYAYTTVYAHLSKINVKVGQYVNANDVIGELGSTGRSTGPHLHYEVRHKNVPLNPEHFLDLHATAPKI